MTQLSKPGTAPGAGDGAVYDHVHMLCRIVLSGAETGGSFAMVEERAALGATTPKHVHAREAETFIVLDGALEGWCEGSSTFVEAGSMIHLPAGKEHAFRIASASAHYYTLITPSGFEGFFRESGVLLDQPFGGALPVPAPLSPEEVGRLVELVAPYGVEIVGPPPFGPAE